MEIQQQTSATSQSHLAVQRRMKMTRRDTQDRFAIRTLTFVIPASDVIGTNQESTKVRKFARQLQQFPDTGTVTKCGGENNYWSVVLELRKGNHLDDDELLFSALVPLMKIMTTSPLLQNGFGLAPPFFQFKAGDVVIDQEVFRNLH